MGRKPCGHALCIERVRASVSPQHRNERIRGGAEGRRRGTCRGLATWATISSELEQCKRGPAEGANKRTSRPRCIVWLWLPGYLYVSPLQKKEAAPIGSRCERQWQGRLEGGSQALPLQLLSSSDCDEGKDRLGVEQNHKRAMYNPVHFVPI